MHQHVALLTQNRCRSQERSMTESRLACHHRRFAPEIGTTENSDGPEKGGERVRCEWFFFLRDLRGSSPISVGAAK